MHVPKPWFAQPAKAFVLRYTPLIFLLNFGDSQLSTGSTSPITFLMLCSTENHHGRWNTALHQMSPGFDLLDAGPPFLKAKIACLITSFLHVASPVYT